MSFRKSGAARWGLLFVTVVASNQTLAADAAAIAFSAPTATLTTPGVSVPVPYQRPFAARGLRTWGPSAPSTTPSGGGLQTLASGSQTLAISAPTAARTAGAIGVPAGSLVLALTAPAATRAATVSVAAGAQSLIVTAPLATRTAGGIGLAAGAQVLVLTAPPASLSAGASSTTSWMGAPFRRPIAQRGIQSWGPPPLSVSTLGATLAAGSQTLAISAPTATRTAGASGVAAGAQTLAISAPTAIAVPSGPQSLTAGAQTLALSAPLATLGVSGQSVPILFRVAVVQKPGGTGWGQAARSTTPNPPATQSLAAGSQTLAITAPAATRTTTKSLTAGATTLAITAPTATVNLATIRAAGGQTLAISAPLATRTVTAVTRAAGSQTLAITAPTAVRLATFTRAAGTQTLAISAPTAFRVIGACLLPAGVGPQTLAITAPSVVILGAATLPANIIVATIENRSPRRTLALTAASSYAVTVLADGPVAYWRLGETSGASAIDATGHGHTGTYLAGVTLGQPGAVGDGAHAITVNATTLGRATLPDLGPLSAISVELWCQTALVSASNRPAWSSAFGSYLGVTGANEVSCSLATDLDIIGVPTAGIVLSTGVWHQLVLTWAGDGTTVELYVDGVHRGTSLVLNGTLALGGAVGVIGGWQAILGNAFTWDGSIDDVAIYGAALTPVQIADHYRARLGITSGLRTLTFTGGARTVRFTG